MSILVTGSHGCVGARAVKTLRPIAEPKTLAAVMFVRGDVTHGAALAGVIEKHDVTRIIHLAAFQIPLCRQDPARGALVNVVGAAAVLEAARAHRDRVRQVACASSVAVFGPASAYPPGSLGDDAARMPATHYGVYKVANEDSARIHWLEDERFEWLLRAGRLDTRELGP